MAAATVGPLLQGHQPFSPNPQVGLEAEGAIEPDLATPVNVAGSHDHDLSRLHTRPALQHDHAGHHRRHKRQRCLHHPLWNLLNWGQFRSVYSAFLDGWNCLKGMPDRCRGEFLTGCPFECPRNGFADAFHRHPGRPASVNLLRLHSLESLRTKGLDRKCCLGRKRLVGHADFIDAGCCCAILPPVIALCKSQELGHQLANGQDRLADRLCRRDNSLPFSCGWVSLNQMLLPQPGCFCLLCGGWFTVRAFP